MSGGASSERGHHGVRVTSRPHRYARQRLTPANHARDDDHTPSPRDRLATRRRVRQSASPGRFARFWHATQEGAHSDGSDHNGHVQLSITVQRLATNARLGQAAAAGTELACLAIVRTSRASAGLLRKCGPCRRCVATGRAALESSGCASLVRSPPGDVRATR
jgi:hypothetical protein